MHLTDEELVAAYVGQGDDRAFQLLVERHQNRIYGFLVGMVRDSDVADDLFQDTFVRVIHALQHRRGSYENQGRFAAWVLRIARNVALDYLRRRRKWWDSDNRSDNDGRPWEALPDEGPNALERVETEDESRWLDACIAELPPEQREVLLLRHDGELTFREIAQLTDCSINTALGRMRYALTNLRRIIARSKKDGLVRAG